jgi:tetratricopeptide (TPR) repeat protein
MERDLGTICQPKRSGTIFISPHFMIPGTFWGKPALCEAQPAARMGNVFVYRGTFDLPGMAAGGLYGHGMEKLYADKPDLKAAEEAFRKSAEMDPTAFFVHIELGNLLLKRGEREGAWGAYANALKYAPDDPAIRQPIEQQMEQMRSQPAGEIRALRDPFME